MIATYHDDLIAAAKAAGQVANYCDHADHNEPVEAAWVLGAAECLRAVAQRIAEREGLDLIEAYAARLAQIEDRNVQTPLGSFDAPAEARRATTWRELQRVQAEHDRLYHPDVIGLHKSDQLQHCSLHLTKLVAALAGEPSSGEEHADFLARRLPDMLLFGLKLPTTMGVKLPDSAIETQYVAYAESAVA